MTVQKLSTRKILERNLSREPTPLLENSMVWLHNIRSLHNVGSAFRSADAFGISQLLISGYTPSPPRAEISKTAIGAEKYVDWEHSDDYEDLLEYVRKKNKTIIGIEQTDGSVPLPEFDPPAHNGICLVFGNEVTGIDNELLSHMDGVIEIPQYGHKHSLNVAVSIGVVMYGLLEKTY